MLLLLCLTVVCNILRVKKKRPKKLGHFFSFWMYTKKYYCIKLIIHLRTLLENVIQIQYIYPKTSNSLAPKLIFPIIWLPEQVFKTSFYLIGLSNGLALGYNNIFSKDYVEILSEQQSIQCSGSQTIKGLTV